MDKSNKILHDVDIICGASVLDTEVLLDGKPLRGCRSVDVSISIDEPIPLVRLVIAPDILKISGLPCTDTDIESNTKNE